MYALEPANKSYWLSRLCESNYAKLLGLVPDLARIEASAMAVVSGKPSLHMRVTERCPYTLTLELTHSFTEGFERLFEPALQLRVYLDACVVEVLSDSDRPKVTYAVGRDGGAQQVLDYKWTLNYFLSRWLDHCAASHYRFVHADAATDPRSSAATA